MVGLHRLWGLEFVHVWYSKLQLDFGHALQGVSEVDLETPFH